MSFLDSKYQKYLNELFELRKKGNKLLIPIGPQRLCISKVEYKESSNDNLMIIISISKYELISEYASINLYYVIDYNNPRICDKEGTPYAIKGLEFFMQNAYNYKIVHYSSDKVNWIISQIKDFKNKPFWAIISHSQRLYMKGEELIIKITDNLPAIIYDVEIIEYSQNKPVFDSRKYPSLLKGLTDEDKRTYQYYVKKRDDDYQNKINSIL